MNKRPLIASVFLYSVCLCSVASAHQHKSMVESANQPPKVMELPELLNAFGWDLASTEIRSEKLSDGLFVLFGAGGNIAVSIGDDGVLIVDDQFPELIPKIKSSIKELGGGDIDYAITTHWHFDHAEGNLSLGPNGTVLVAHENSREMMQGDHLINLVAAAYQQKAYPESALPDITFKDEMQFHLNGESIKLLHFGPAHTTGDAAIYFSKSNVVHMGDVFNNAGYPFIDADNGGSISGVITFCQNVLKQINQDTIVLPGHGPVSDYSALQDYIEMLSEVKKRIQALIDNGASLEEVIAADVSKEWDQGKTNKLMFINRVYTSLKRQQP